MERVGNFLRKHVPVVQPAVERAAAAQLGEVAIRPYADNCVLGTAGRRWTLLLYQLLSPELLMTQGATIYYNTSISTLVVPGVTLWNMAAHELGHIAHRRIVGKDIIVGPQDLGEDVANYFAEQALNSLGKKTVLRVRQGAHRFQRQLYQHGAPETQEGIAQYLQKTEQESAMRAAYDF